MTETVHSGVLRVLFFRTTILLCYSKSVLASRVAELQAGEYVQVVFPGVVVDHDLPCGHIDGARRHSQGNATGLEWGFLGMKTVGVFVG